MASVSDEQPSDRTGFGHQDIAGSDTPTPPTGFSMGAGAMVPAAGADDATPPSGIGGLTGAVTAEDYGRPSPTVLGGPEPADSHDDAGSWPTLEYRRRGKEQRGSGRNWLGRRRRDDE